MLRLYSPVSPTAGLTTPQGWGLETAFTTFRDAGCSATISGAFATAVTGVVAFDAGGSLPGSIESLAVNLTFPPDAGITALYLGAEQLPVAGGCP